MPKIVVTEGLADTLKMLRHQNGIKSKDLAKHINKTPGYVSKLEKKEIKTIEWETVDSIFSFILGDEYKKTEIWEQVYASLQIKYSTTELDEEIWFSNFDTVYRNVPIPDSLVDFLNEKIISLDINRDILLQRINANEALSDDIINDKKIKVNIWYPSKTGKGSFIKIDMGKERLANILDKITKSSPYVFVFCILFYLLKIEEYGTEVTLTDPQNKQIYKKATAILNSYKFYSISERESLIAQAQSREEIQSLLSSFDNNNVKLVSEILDEFKFASEMDIRITNERLTKFLDNLKKDIWFTLRVISLDYYLLDELDIPKRKEFLKDVDDLIRKYYDNQKNTKNTETY